MSDKTVDFHFDEMEIEIPMLKLILSINLVELGFTFILFASLIHHDFAPECLGALTGTNTMKVMFLAVSICYVNRSGFMLHFIYHLMTSVISLIAFMTMVVLLYSSYIEDMMALLSILITAFLNISGLIFTIFTGMNMRRSSSPLKNSANLETRIVTEAV